MRPPGPPDHHPTTGTSLRCSMNGTGAAHARVPPLGRTRSRSASPPRSRLESCAPAEAPSTSRDDGRAGSVTPGDLVWAKIFDHRGWRRNLKGAASQEREARSRNLDALARQERQEAARYCERRQLDAARRAAHREFLARETFDSTGSGGFFATAPGGGLKTLGVGQKGADTRERGAFDANMTLLRKRSGASKITARLQLWLSDFQECPVCAEQCMEARDVVRGVVVPHGAEEHVQPEHLQLARDALPRCGKTIFTCRHCEWSTEFAFDESGSPRFPETRHWKRPAAAARPSRFSAEGAAASATSGRADADASAERASPARPTTPAAEGLPDPGSCGRPGEEEHGGAPHASADPAAEDRRLDAPGDVGKRPDTPSSRSPFGILLSTPCRPSPFDKKTRKSLSPLRFPRCSEQGAAVLCMRECVCGVAYLSFGSLARLSRVDLICRRT
jgi:hypothetical protein